jgi:hypothetical protein
VCTKPLLFVVRTDRIWNDHTLHNRHNYLLLSVLRHCTVVRKLCLLFQFWLCPLSEHLLTLSTLEAYIGVVHCRSLHWRCFLFLFVGLKSNTTTLSAALSCSATFSFLPLAVLFLNSKTVLDLVSTVFGN